MKSEIDQKCFIDETGHICHCDFTRNLLESRMVRLLILNQLTENYMYP